MAEKRNIILFGCLIVLSLSYWISAAIMIGEKPFEIRVGINTGFCNVGNFGSEQRLTYTIIGGEVNIAARLETAGDAGKILMSNETYAHVREIVDVKELNSIKMKGVSRDVKVFEVIGRKSDNINKLKVLIKLQN